MMSVCVRATVLTGLLMVSFQVLQAQNAAPPFSLTLSAGTRNKNVSEFRAGSKVWITITQKNLTDHPIDCTEIASNGVDSSFRYDVRDEE